MLQWLFGTKPALQTRRTSAAGFKSERDVKTLVSAGAMVTIYLIGMLVSIAVLPWQFGKLPEKAIAVVGFATPAVCFFLMTFVPGITFLNSFTVLATLHFIGGAGAGCFIRRNSGLGPQVWRSPDVDPVWRSDIAGAPSFSSIGQTNGHDAALVRAELVQAGVKRLANDTEYGRSAAVFSRDIQRALAVAGRIESCICHINGPTVADEPQMPFGGVKVSGHGRFGGKAAIAEFTDLR